MKHFCLENNWKNKLLTILCIVGSIPVWAQVQIRGKVTDSEGHPIAYATIGTSETNAVTFTNEQGRFSLWVSALPVELHVHEIGFITNKLTVNSQELSVVLQTAEYALNEFTVKPVDITKLADKAWRRLVKNRYKISNGKAFYRMITRNDSTWSELMESFSDVRTTATGIHDFLVTDGRFAIDDQYRKKDFIISVDFSAAVKFLNLINDHDDAVHFPDFPFRANASTVYRFSDAGVQYEGDIRLRMIDYAPVKSVMNAFAGTMWVDEKTGDVYKIVASIYRLQSDFVSINRKEPVQHLRLTYQLRFDRGNDKQMLLNQMSLTMNYQYNNRNRTRQVETRIECVVYDRSSGLNYSFGLRPEDETLSDYDLIRSRLYIRPFWDSHQVMMQTDLQREIAERFEQRGLFGISYTYLNDSATMSLIGMPIVRAGSALQIESMSSVPETRMKDPGNIDIYLNGTRHGTVCSHLFLAQNCYQNTYYFSVLPVLIQAQCWISDSLRDDERFPFVFKLYTRLARVHASRLTHAIMGLNKPCQHMRIADKLMQDANKAFTLESNDLFQDCWADQKWQVWEKYLSKEEEELGLTTH